MTIEFRNGKYYCRFQIDGKRYHQLCKGAKTFKQAEKFETELKYITYNKQDGEVILMQVLYETFQKYSKQKRKTYKQDMTRLNFIKQYIPANMPAEDVKSAQILKLIEALNEKQLQPKTINLYLAILREIFNMALDDDLVSANPVKRKFNLKVEPSEPNTIKDYEDEQRLMEVATPIFRAIIHFTLNTGLRRESVIDIKWSNINFTEKMITITKNKGNKLIRIPMTDSLYNMLSSMYNGNHDENVFINPQTNQPYKTTSFNKQWRVIREKAGLSTLRFHDLRHTVASRLAKANIPVPAIKMFLAHSDIGTTMKYVHTDEAEINNAISVLNKNNLMYENTEWTQNGHENEYKQ